MTSAKSSRNKESANLIKKITLPDGFRVGISNLDQILKEVADLNLTDNRSIKKELLDRAKSFNYIPAGSEDEYSTALYDEYQRKFGKSTAAQNKIELHTHTPG